MSTMILQPAIEQYGAPYVDAAGKHPILIRLIDEPKNRREPSILVVLILPVTLAVVSKIPADKSLVCYYRNQSFEVVVPIDYPERAKAKGVEVVLSAVLSNMKEAVAVMEYTSLWNSTDFQRDV